MPEKKSGLWVPGENWEEKLPKSVRTPLPRFDSVPKPEVPPEKPVIYDQFDRPMVIEEPEDKLETEI